MKYMPAWVATKDEAAERFQICTSCDKITILKTCKICGCFMPVKVKLRNLECPDGKWQQIPYRSTGTWLSEDPEWDHDIHD